MKWSCCFVRKWIWKLVWLHMDLCNIIMNHVEIVVYCSQFVYKLVWTLGHVVSLRIRVGFLSTQGLQIYDTLLIDSKIKKIKSRILCQLLSIEKCVDCCIEVVVNTRMLEMLQCERASDYQECYTKKYCCVGFYVSYMRLNWVS